MSQPLVSVIITTYDRPHYLRLAIQSALDQTYPSIEVIVGEDCGPPHMASIARTLPDQRLRWFRNEQNLGVAGNIRKAFQTAQGEFLISLNDDDLLDRDCVRALVEPLIADPGLVLAFGDQLVIDSEGTVDPAASDEHQRRFHRHTLQPGAVAPFYDLALVRQSIPVPSAGCLFRRTALNLDDWPPQIGVSYDWFLAYQLCTHGKAAYYVPTVVGYCRFHPGQLTVIGNPARNYQSLLYCLERFLQDDRLRDCHAYFRNRYTKEALGYSMALLLLGKRKEARRTLDTSCKPRPSVGYLLRYALTWLPLPIVRSTIQFVRRSGLHSAAA